MSQPEKTGMLYDQIIARVIEESRERFEAEGADQQVLGELQKVSHTSRFPSLRRTSVVAPAPAATSCNS